MIDLKNVLDGKIFHMSLSNRRNNDKSSTAKDSCAKNVRNVHKLIKKGATGQDGPASLYFPESPSARKKNANALMRNSMDNLRSKASPSRLLNNFLVLNPY